MLSDHGTVGFTFTDKENCAYSILFGNSASLLNPTRGIVDNKETFGKMVTDADLNQWNNDLLVLQIEGMIKLIYQHYNVLNYTKKWHAFDVIIQDYYQRVRQMPPPPLGEKDEHRFAIITKLCNELWVKGSKKPDDDGKTADKDATKAKVEYSDGKRQFWLITNPAILQNLGYQKPKPLTVLQKYKRDVSQTKRRPSTSPASPASQKLFNTLVPAQGGTINKVMFEELFNRSFQLGARFLFKEVDDDKSNGLDADEFEAAYKMLVQRGNICQMKHQHQKLLSRRRRMAQREFSNRRDSPVMVRLLQEIVAAQDD